MNQANSNSYHPGAKRNIVVIGTSAGGLKALTALVAGLPKDFPAAILVVMHIPPSPPTNLAHFLEKAGPLPAAQAQDGEPIYAGRIYVAPPDRHLVIDGDRLRVTRSPKENHARPCINVLFRSAAYHLGTRAIGVVLTGTLDDGTAGLWAIKDRGGLTMVQAPTEADYPSMPQNALDHVAIDAVVPIAEMPEILNRWTNETLELGGEKPMSSTLEIEHQIGLGSNAMRVGSMELGAPSSLTCPECHGAMVKIVEGSLIRFRCHTGHAYSIKTLLSDVNEGIDDGLWNVIRSIEERILLLRDLAKVAKQEEEARYCLAQALQAERRVEQLRQLVLDPNELGHDTDPSSLEPLQVSSAVAE